jgi:hypothetical protein
MASLLSDNRPRAALPRNPPTPARGPRHEPLERSSLHVVLESAPEGRPVRGRGVRGGGGFDTGQLLTLALSLAAIVLVLWFTSYCFRRATRTTAYHSPGKNSLPSAGPSLGWGARLALRRLLGGTTWKPCRHSTNRNASILDISKLEP